jgi:spore coat polysaccharide biosynthesis protein SpsF
LFEQANEKIVCTIEARMTSSRFPGKILKPLNGTPALEMMIDRVRRSRYVDEVVVATTVNAQDDPIEALCRRLNCTVQRGSENDVLKRVLDAAGGASADLIVELTSDCPFIDHRHIDKTIELYYSGAYDYAANVLERSFPIGFDVQVFPLRVLKQVDSLTQDPIDRVHVSYYIYNHPDRFRLANWTATGELYWPELGVTLDEPADYQLLDALAKRLEPKKPDFTAEDIVNMLRAEPALLEINRAVRRKDASEG